MKNKFPIASSPARGAHLADKRITATRLAAALCAATGLATASPAHAGSPPPRIAGVSFTASGDTYTATINGVNFGPTPSGIPCNACSPIEMQVVDLASQPQQESINVTSWSDTSVTITGITAAAGDAMRVAVYNATAGNAAAWGGRISHADHVPRITSIAATPNGAKTVVTITGSGFGPAPSEVGQTTTSPFLVLTDYNRKAVNDDGFPWNGGFCDAHNCNEVTVAYTSWTDTQVVISGYGADYYGGGEDGAWKVNPRDAFCVGIWSTKNPGLGTTGGTTKCIRLPK